jgi:DNA (cytosine-5)-methyltransferase 1
VSLRVVSLFSGVGGFDLGLERAGMTTVAQVEWDPKCQQVLARHWPHVPRWGDVSDVDGADLPDCDLVAFGSPCQDLSVAGKRAGMVEGETRSGLFYEAVRIIKELQEHDRGPAWVIWENVVGALSSNRGLDFAAVVDSLGELGAVDIQWRVLDAQWFGVPQRRRRVFVVACLNPGAAGGPQVLPVGASVRRDSPTGSETGQEVAGCLGGGSGERGWSPDTDRMTFIATRDVTSCLRASSMNVDDNTAQDGHFVSAVSPTLPAITGSVTTAFGPKNYSNLQEVSQGSVIPVAVAENQRGEVRTSETVPSLSSGGGKPGEGYPAVLSFDSTFGNQSAVFDNLTPPLKVGSGIGISSPPAVMADLAVRRLTPTECERLMGWPDGWTAEGVDTAGNPVTIADSSRYRMCGNGVATPVAEWIGRCILNAEAER